MTIRAWTQFYDWVLPDLPGSPATGLVDKACVSVCRDFCTETVIQQEELAAVNVVAATGSYALVSSDPTNFDVMKVMELYVDGEELDPKTRDELKRYYRQRWQSLTGTPEFFTQYDASNVVLVPIPDTSITAGLEITAALVPALGATGLVDVVFDDWAENIADGIKGKMMLQKNKPWSDPNLGAAAWGKYLEARDQAKSNSAKNFARTRRRTTGSFF